MNTLKGIVAAPRPGGAWVKLDAGSYVRALNALNVRPPPRSRVLLVQDERGVYRIVGRDR
jgi:hypothetical protein